MRFHLSVDVDYLQNTGRAVGDIVECLADAGCLPSLFVAGKMVPEVGADLQHAAAAGCEVGCHGWAHPEDPAEDFRVLPPARQVELLERGKASVGDCVGAPPRLFRAPNLWISAATVGALAQTGFTIDSSVPSGRIDLLAGRIRTARYLNAPRRPYELSTTDVTARGESGVVEVPLVTAVVPINMTSLRCFGAAAVARLSAAVARRSGYVVFYCHPWEFVAASEWDRSVLPRRHSVRVGPANLRLLRSYVGLLRARGLRHVSMRELAAAA